MSSQERSRNFIPGRPALIGAIAAAAIFAADKFDILPDLNGDAEPRINSVEAEHEVSDIKSIQKILLTESKGTSSATLEGELKFTGFLSGVKNVAGDVLGNNLHTEIDTRGMLQLGVEAGGLLIESKPDEDGKTEVTVDTGKLFTQQVYIEAEPNQTDTNDGFFVNLRRVLHEDEANVDGRADALENFARTNHEIKCSPYLLSALPGSVADWVQKQRPDIKDRTDITIVNEYGERLSPERIELESPAADEAAAVSKIEGEIGDLSIDVKNIIPGECAATSRALEQIKQINEGVDIPSSTSTPAL